MRVGLIAVPIVDGEGEIEGASLAPVGADALRPCPPYAVYLLAAVLAKAGHDPVVIDLIADGSGVLDPGDAIDDCDVVGISASSLSWAPALQTIDHVRRRRPDVFIVAGGVHASQFDSWVIAHSAIDAVIRGDGEWPIVSLCDALTHGTHLDSVPSLSWRDQDGMIRRNPAGPPVESADLTTWLPLYEQLPHRSYFGLALETSRGCAFACSFCSTPHKGRWRGGDPSLVVDQLEALVPFLPKAITNSVYIVDDEFTMNPRRARDVAQQLTNRELPLGLLYDSRATDLVRDGLVEALAPHTHSLLVGAECGYDAGLARVGKGTTTAGLRAAADRLAREGIAQRADFSFILGLPWEGPDQVQATLDFGFQLASDFGVRLLFNWYAQIPGSALWDQARAEGRIHESRYDYLGVQRDPEVFFKATRLTSDDVRTAVSYGRSLKQDLGPNAPEPELGLPVAVSNPSTPSLAPINPLAAGSPRPVVIR